MNRRLPEQSTGTGSPGHSGEGREGELGGRERWEGSHAGTPGRVGAAPGIVCIALGKRFLHPCYPGRALGR